MAEFDPLTAPVANPVTVRRVNNQGFPTQWQLEWEQGTRSWMIKNAVDLNAKVTTLRDETNNGFAEVREEIQAVVTDQGALASQVTELTAEFGDFSANGSVQFKVMATPAGAAAAYGIFLNAGTSFTGLQMIAYSGGASAIAFSASQFMLNDSGSAQNVFNYGSGVFTFNVPVRIQNGELLNNAVSQAWANSGGTSASVDVNYRGSGFLEIYAQFVGDAGAYAAIDQFVIRVKEDGVTIADTPINQAQNGTGSGAASRYGSTNIVHIRTPSTGAHNYSVEIVKTIPATALSLSGVLIIVKEFSK